MKRLLLIIPLLYSCGIKQQSDDDAFIEFINICVYTQFVIDYPDTTLLTMNTKQLNSYYLTDVYYYDANVYKTEYISAVNDKDELIVKEVMKNETINNQYL